MIRTLSLAVLLFLGGCAASAPEVTPSAPDMASEDVPVEAPTPARVLLASDLVTANVDGDVERGLEAPGADAAALVVRGADGASIILADRSTGLLEVVYESPVPAELSVAFSAGGERLYVGRRSAAGGAVTEIDVASRATRDVGCTASDVVLGVRTDGALVVRDANNVYVVDAAGCATLHTFDARRMIEITVAPGGSHLAYVHRELSYNRESRAYEPDTTLHVVATTGGEPTRVIGDRYAPRRISWMQDAQSHELAYDVLLQDGSGRRGLSIYSVASGQSSWTIPPERLSGSATDGHYGPDPGTFVFQLDGAWHYRTGVGSFVQPLPVEFAPEHVVWVGPDVLWVRRGETSAFVELSSRAAPEPTPGAVWAWSNR